MTEEPLSAVDMIDNFEHLEREQIKMRRDLADKLDKGGPKAKARAQELRELADRMERQLAERDSDST